MANGNDVLGPQDLEQLKQRLNELDEADRTIQKAIAAGLDMEANRKRSQELRAQLIKIRQAFFPGQ